MADKVALVLHSAATRILVESLLPFMPLWIVDTDTNRALLSDINPELCKGHEPDWVTTFVIQDSEDRLSNAGAIVRTIWEHHAEMIGLHIYGLNHEELQAVALHLPSVEIIGVEHAIGVGTFKFAPHE